MNKTELAEKLATQTGLSKAKAAEVVNAIFSTDPREGIIAVELDAGRKVQITGFGTFETRSRSERKGVNPGTGDAITIPAKKYAAFKTGKGLKERVER
ncbi:MAG TPA: HU family DNA-binding protein [Trueperaceae bacterium]|nr:HU family DNA-binding protein [Trueperaceae bacterium]